MDPSSNPAPCYKCGSFSHLASNRNCPRDRPSMLLATPTQLPATTRYNSRSPSRSPSPPPEKKHIKDARQGDATKFWFYESVSDDDSEGGDEDSTIPGPPLDRLFDDDELDESRGNAISKASNLTSSVHYAQNDPRHLYDMSTNPPPQSTLHRREHSNKMVISNREVISMFPDSEVAPLQRRRRAPTANAEPAHFPPPPPPAAPKPAKKPRLTLHPPAPPPPPPPQPKSTSKFMAIPKQKNPISKPKSKVPATTTTTKAAPKKKQAIPTPPAEATTLPKATQRRRVSSGTSKARPRLTSPKDAAPKASHAKKPRQTLMNNVAAPVLEDHAVSDDNGVPTPETLSPVPVPVADPDDTDVEMTDVEEEGRDSSSEGESEEEDDEEEEPKSPRFPGRNSPPPEALTSTKAYHEWLDRPKNDEFSAQNIAKLRKTQMYNYLGARNNEFGPNRVSYGRHLQGWRESRSTGGGLDGPILEFHKRY